MTLILMPGRRSGKVEVEGPTQLILNAPLKTDWNDSTGNFSTGNYDGDSPPVYQTTEGVQAAYFNTMSRGCAFNNVAGKVINTTNQTYSIEFWLKPTQWAITYTEKYFHSKPVFNQSADDKQWRLARIWDFSPGAIQRLTLHDYRDPNVTNVNNAKIASTLIQGNTWNHIRLIFKTTEVRMSVNGKLAGTATNTKGNALNAPWFMLGSGYNNGFKGWMRDFRVFLGEKLSDQFTPPPFS